jgi:Flp pilus assembly protein TadD
MGPSHGPFPSLSTKCRIGILLVLLIFATFWQVCDHPFVLFDDDLYITDNPRVTMGLTREGIAWAFATNHAFQWHPLTWLSHMLDVELFGLNPHGHHFTSLLIHTFSSVFLFLLLSEITGALWVSAFVAAVFSLHPLRVESVAWAAERKDVLYAFFWVATTWAYARYTRRGSLSWYLLALFFFLLGLLSKPMMVTLPFALLLLDYWPLRRYTTERPLPGISPSPFSTRTNRGPGILAEKIPFFLLTILRSVITYAAANVGKTLASTEAVPFGLRIANSLVAYVQYIGMILFPSSLAVYYPYNRAGPPFWQVAGAILLLSGISVLSLRFRKRAPYLPVGWFWFLGTLFPVIGIVYIGLFSIADRFVYIPTIGLLILVAHGVSDLSRKWTFRKPALSVLSIGILTILAVATWRQTSHWRSSTALFRHAIEATACNHVAEMNLGVSLEREGKTREAIEHFRNAISIYPGYADAYYNLALAMDRLGNTDEAISNYQATIRIRPNHSSAHNNLGFIYFRQGRTDDAIPQFRKALFGNPAFSQAHINLGAALGKSGRIEEAIFHFREAVRLEPDNAMAHYNLGLSFAVKGETDAAIFHFREVVRITPENREAAQRLNRLLSVTDNTPTFR